MGFHPWEICSHGAFPSLEYVTQSDCAFDGALPHETVSAIHVMTFMLLVWEKYDWILYKSHVSDLKVMFLIWSDFQNPYIVSVRLNYHIERSFFTGRDQTQQSLYLSQNRYHLHLKHSWKLESLEWTFYPTGNFIGRLSLSQFKQETK